jgi:hypothetical protein
MFKHSGRALPARCDQQLGIVIDASDLGSSCDQFGRYMTRATP